MPSTWSFVDQPTASPTVLLNMNDGNTWKCLGDDFLKLPSPPLKRSIAANAMVDGGMLTAAAYDLRTIGFTLELSASTEAGREAQVDALKAQLACPTNLLMFQSELSANPVFFRTLRSDEYNLNTQFVPTQRWRVECNILAEPFAIGIRRDLSTVTVTNDPAATGPALNANTSFEVNTAGWTGIGGTLTRTTAQFHAGVASGTITPDGVTATVRIDAANVAVTGGVTYRAQGWLRCAVARSVALNINWYDSGSNYITTGSGSVSVAATTWTFISTDMVAPPNAAFGNIIPTMTGTPPATNVLWVDEIEMRATAVNGAAYFDITGIVGDAPTPAFIKIGTALNAGVPIILSQRTVNNPTAVTVFAQAEAGTVGTDTTVQANDAAMSGSGSNFVRTTFTTAALTTRLTVTLPTATDAAALRGRYRVFVRVRTSATGSVYTLRYLQNPAGPDFVNGPIVSFSSLVNTEFRHLDLGVVEFPTAGPYPMSPGYSALPAQMVTQALAIQAGRTSGTATLDMDYVYLMPCDERFLVAARNATQANSSLIIDGPNEMAYGQPTGATPFGSTRTVDNAGGMCFLFGGAPMLVPNVTNRWHMIRGNSAISATSAVDVSYWPRWREVATS